MKTFRTFALVVALMLVLAMLPACGTATVSPTTQAPTSATTEIPTPAIDITKVIKISMTCQNTFAVEPDAKYLKIMEDKYHLDLDIWQCYGDEYVNQVNAKIAGGEVADIFYMGGGLSVPEYVNQGIIIEMPESFIQQNMPKYYADLYSVSQDPFKYCRLNGKNYGIPGTSADGFYHFTVIWRNDWLKAVGISKTPETIAEFEDAFYKFTKNDPDGNKKDDTYGLSNLGMIPVFGAFGCIPYNNRPDALGEYMTVKDGKVVHAATQPEMKDALKLLAKWYKDGIIDPEFVTGERKEGHWSSSQAFCGGRIGYTSCGQYYNTASGEERGGADGKVYKMFHETQANMGNQNATYVHGRPPVGPDGKSGAVKWGVEEGICFAFGKPLENDTEKQLRIAMWFDDLWMTQDNYMSAIYGTVGEDWTQDPATGALNVGLTPLTKDAIDKGETSKIGLGYMFLPDIFSAMKKETPVAYAFADKVANYPDCGYANPVSGAPLESIAEYGVDLAKITLTAYYDMISGKKDVDGYFDQYVQEWMNAGGSNVIEEANKWWTANGTK